MSDTRSPNKRGTIANEPTNEESRKRPKVSAGPVALGRDSASYLHSINSPRWTSSPPTATTENYDAHKAAEWAPGPFRLLGRRIGSVHFDSLRHARDLSKVHSTTLHQLAMKYEVISIHATFSDTRNNIVSITQGLRSLQVRVSPSEPVAIGKPYDYTMLVAIKSALYEYSSKLNIIPPDYYQEPNARWHFIRNQAAKILLRDPVWEGRVDTELLDWFMKGGLYMVKKMQNRLSKPPPLPSKPAYKPLRLEREPFKFAPLVPVAASVPVPPVVSNTSNSSQTDFDIKFEDAQPTVEVDTAESVPKSTASWKPISDSPRPQTIASPPAQSGTSREPFILHDEADANGQVPTFTDTQAANSSSRPHAQPITVTQQPKITKQPNVAKQPIATASASHERPPSRHNPASSSAVAVPDSPAPAKSKATARTSQTTALQTPPSSPALVKIKVANYPSFVSKHAALRALYQVVPYGSDWTWADESSSDHALVMVCTHESAGCKAKIKAIRKDERWHIVKFKPSHKGHKNDTLASTQLEIEMPALDVASAGTTPTSSRSSALSSTLSDALVVPCEETLAAANNDAVAATFNKFLSLPLSNACSEIFKVQGIDCPDKISQDFATFLASSDCDWGRLLPFERFLVKKKLGEWLAEQAVLREIKWENEVL